MRAFLVNSAWALAVLPMFATAVARAQVAKPDPDVRGPARRAVSAAAEGLGAPGVENRIENREQRRDIRRSDVDPNAAARAAGRAADMNQVRRFNNDWWYRGPGGWQVYRNNQWTDFDPDVYFTPRGRYSTGYRGTRYDNRRYNEYNLRQDRQRTYANPDRAIGGPANGQPVPGRGAAAGAELGAGIGDAAGGAAATERGAEIGNAVGNTVDAARDAIRAVPPPANPTVPAPSAP
jgi:hypothetical protein